jgi:hypothetical protein
LDKKNSYDDLCAYSEKFLNDWENKSTVRTQKRSRFSKQLLAKVEFAYHLKSYAHYPEVQALTKKQLQPFYLQSFCDMLGTVAIFEVSFVTDQCGKLATQDLGVELSDSVKRAAIAIGTDEMYHALVARELLSDIKTLTGMEPSHIATGAVKKKSVGTKKIKSSGVQLAPLDYFKSAVPPKLQNIAAAIVLCISENSAVDDLIVMARNANKDNPADLYIREHLADESRHSAFFQRLLKYMWSIVTEKDRIILGRAIAGYFVKYISSNEDQRYRVHYNELRRLELSEQTCQTIAREVAQNECNTPLYDVEFNKPAMQLMKIAGVHDHLPTRRLFVRNNLLAA